MLRNKNILIQPCLFVWLFFLSLFLINSSNATTTVLNSQPTQNNNNDDSLSKQYHDLGIQAAQSSDFTLSLGYFRSSCRLDRNNKRYWNDLGVAEMRMKEYKKAESRFLQSLQIDPKYKKAKRNLKEVRSFMSPDQLKQQQQQRRTNSNKLLLQQRHELRELPALEYPRPPSLHIITSDNNHTLSSIPLEYFKILDEPFLIRRADKHWGWRMESLDMDAVVARHGEQIIDYYPHGMDELNVHPYRIPFRHAYRQLERPEDVYHDIDISNTRTYIHWNMLLNDFDALLKSMNMSLPPILNDTFWNIECFDSPEMSNQYHLSTHWKMLLIAEQGAGMFNHRDYLQSASYQIQLVGRKKWHLCAPSEDSYLYNDGDIDTFHPDYERFPNALQATCYQFTVDPGDFVYYPKSYWHQTLNLDTPSIAITGTLVTPGNYKDVREKLEVQCEGKGNLFMPDPVFCKQLQKCYQYWEDYFGTPTSTKIDSKIDKSESLNVKKEEL